MGRDMAEPRVPSELREKRPFHPAPDGVQLRASSPDLSSCRCCLQRQESLTRYRALRCSGRAQGPEVQLPARASDDRKCWDSTERGRARLGPLPLRGIVV